MVFRPMLFAFVGIGAYTDPVYKYISSDSFAALTISVITFAS